MEEFSEKGFPNLDDPSPVKKQVDHRSHGQGNGKPFVPWNTCETGFHDDQECREKKSIQKKINFMHGNLLVGRNSMA